MTAFTVLHDSASGQWRLVGEVPHGDAGLGSVAITSNAAVHVDYKSGGIVEICIDEEGPGGGADPDLLAMLRLDRQQLDGRSIDLDGETCAIMARLALLEECRRERALGGPTSSWWSAEANALRRLMGQSAAFSDAPPVLSGAPAWIQQRSAVVGGPRRGSLEVQLDQIVEARRTRGPLGSVPETSHMATVDASYVPSGRIDTRAGVWIDRQLDSASIRVEAHVQESSYAAALSDVIVLIVDETSDAVVSMSPMILATGRTGELMAVADLVVSGTRSSSELSIHLASAEAPTVPSHAVRRHRRLIHAARTAADIRRISGVGNSALHAGGVFLGELADAAEHRG